MKDWIDFLKWKNERSEARMKTGLTYMTGGVAILAFIATAVSNMGWEYVNEDWMRLALFSMGVGSGIALLFIGLMYIGLGGKRPRQYAQLINRIMIGEIADVETVKKEFWEEKWNEMQQQKNNAEQSISVSEE
jgi:hypothetical protein